MSDLIRRTDVLETYADLYWADERINAFRNDLDKVFEDLRSLPSAQPEIIRCKDCRHNGSFDTDCPIDWNGKEYCSFAER